MDKEIYVNKIKTKKDGFHLALELPDGISDLKAELVYYNQEKSFVHILSYIIREKTLLLTLPVPALELYAGDWKLTLYDQTADSSYIPVLSSRLRIRLILGNYSVKRGNFLFFPLGSKGHQLVLRCRTASRYDGLSTRLKEFGAFGLYKLTRPLWKNKNIWLVFEKYCISAQDNGFYFFRYCMEQLPPKERSHIYFILDRNSRQWDSLENYRKQVIPFMSFRHIFYMLIADLYVASDARPHGYIWEPLPNLISREINRHPIFFLQHGVTALKRVDHIFGKNGFTPMTYFAVTSSEEQKIVTEHFGYDREHTPIVGFARWDALENKADSGDKNILVMPTWRSWLEGKSDEFFCSSGYYRTYMSLFQNQELLSFLEETETTLTFYIHPKLREFMKNFHTQSSRIRLIPFGEAALNELIMKCSMLVTDYSSVCWDVYYLGKPVLFYQFDLELYEETNGSYIDMEKELFGDRCIEENQLTALIKEYVRNDFQEKEAYRKMREKAFAFGDRNNCRRTYDYIKKQGY